MKVFFVLFWAGKGKGKGKEDLFWGYNEICNGSF